MYVRIVNGKQRLKEIMDNFLKSLYNYNASIRGLGYYLKPYHVVVYKSRYGTKKYYYYGRYWYRVKYVGKKGKTSIVKWEYVGKNKPDKRLPDPPPHPLEGIVFLIEGEDIIMREVDYVKVGKLFEGLKIVKMML